jgi:hypothetical protein
MITDAQKLEAWKVRMGQRCKCGAKKPQGHPFCAACWEKLPGPLQHALLEHLTKNFNDRYFEAAAFLQPKEPLNDVGAPDVLFNFVEVHEK